MASIKDNTLTSVKEGSIVNFKAIALTPLKSLKVNFTPIQLGEGDPSPENIRAIKGWTGLNVYNGTTIPVSWSDLGTVYGGYVDLISGEVWQTYVCELPNDQKWYLTTNRNAYQWGHTICDCTFISYKNHFCSHFINTSWSNEYFAVLNANGAMYLGKNFWLATGMTTEEITLENISNYLTTQKNAGTQVQICAPLPTPILVGTIDPITIKSLIGTNNIYSDADSVNVEYYNLESLNLYKQRFKANQPYLQTANGSVASFLTALKAPLKECKVYFLPVQDLGTPSPDNILPISGWTGFDLWRTGKNVAHQVGWSATNINSPTSNRTFSNSYGTTINTTSPNNTITITQSLTIDTVNIYSYKNGYISYIPDNLIFETLYKVSFNVTDIVSNPLNATLSNIKIYNPSGESPKTQSVIGNRIYYTIMYNQYSNIPNRTSFEIRNCGMSCTISDFMVTPANEIDLTYEPYNGSTTSITLPSEVGTVYGGYVDLINGEIIQTMGYKHFDENDDWRASSGTSHSPYRYYILSVQPSNGIYEPVISDKLAPYSAWDPYPYMAVLNNGGHLTVGAPEELSTVDTFKAWLQEIGGVDVAYPLVTPIHYPLDPITIKTLKGINNIWSNTNGNILTKYWTYGSLAKRKTFTWNQWVPLLISENWQPQNVDYSTLSIDNNIATINIIQDVTAVYLSSMKSKKTNVPWILDHKYYIRQDINPSLDSDYVIIRYNSWVGGKRCLKDEWTTLKVVTTSTTTGSNVIYLGYCSVADQSTVGKVTKVKNPMIIDLTQMFGEGNEPTLLEFESLCARNGIDLTQYQPYDEGSTVNWYV